MKISIEDYIVDDKEINKLLYKYINNKDYLAAFFLEVNFLETKIKTVLLLLDTIEKWSLLTISDYKIERDYDDEGILLATLGKNIDRIKKYTFHFMTKKKLEKFISDLNAFNKIRRILIHHLNTHSSLHAVNKKAAEGGKIFLKCFEKLNLIEGNLIKLMEEKVNVKKKNIKK